MPEPRTQPEITIESIAERDVNVSDMPDEKTQSERDYLDLQRKETELESLKQNIKERQKYAGRIFWLIVFWLIGVGIILLLQGFGAEFEIFVKGSGFKLNGFNLSNKVLITLIGGTTINVLGIFAIVANYLFPKSPKQASR